MEMLNGLPLSENEVEIISKVLNSESAPLEALLATVAEIMIDLAKKEVKKKLELFRNRFFSKKRRVTPLFWPLLSSNAKTRNTKTSQNARFGRKLSVCCKKLLKKSQI